MVTVTKPNPPITIKNGRSGGGGDSGGSDRFGRSPSPSQDAGLIGLLAFLATVTMLFAGAVSALIIRREAGLASHPPDWSPIYFPKILWVNTAVILFSSVTLELSRSALIHSKRSLHRILITVTAFLGIAFLTG